MDRSYPYSRRLVSRTRLRKRMAAIAATAVASVAALFMLTWKPDTISAAIAPAAQPLLAFAGGAGKIQGVRRIYPYSVIPGGVSGAVELARVVRTDRVVAAHYASFDVDKARPVVVDKPRAVHVSYRKGGKVYWTARKVMLDEGETLLSDGRNEMRARCANRISDVPQYPVEAHQPAMEELDDAVELDEGETYALGPDGMPVSTDPHTGMPRQPGKRFPVRGGGGIGGLPVGAPADATLSASFSSSSAAPGLTTAMGLSGSSSSMGSRPRPTSSAPATIPTTVPTTGAGTESGSGSSSGSPPPSGGAGDATPLPPPASDTPVTTPQPQPVTTLPPVETPPPAELPGTTPVPGPVPVPVPPAVQNPLPDPLPQPVPAPMPMPTPVPDTMLPPVFTPDPVPPAPPVLPVLPVPPLPPLPPISDGPPSSQPGPVTEPFIPKPELTAPPLETGTDDLEQPSDVPEPGSLWLTGLALAALLLRRRA